MSELDPLEPQAGLTLYLQSRENELAAATHRTHKGRLSDFIDWCEANNIENLNTLTGRQIQRYKISKSEEMKPITVKSYLDTLRVFARFLVTIDAVPEHLPDKIQSPNINSEDEARTAHIDADTAADILDYLRTYKYASVQHVIFRLLWRTGMRRGALRALDVDDVNLDQHYLKLHHRPETGTPLKNGSRGERHIAISPETAQLLQDWIQDQRPDGVGTDGRRPLISCGNGRLHGQTIQAHIYDATRPCLTGECPHDRDPQDCEAVGGYTKAYKCPSNIAPHDIRRSSITHFLKNDIAIGHVSDRADVSEEVIRKHYDQMTSKEKMEQRREHLNNL